MRRLAATSVHRLEGVANVFDRGAASFGPGDGHNVEAGSVAQKPVAFQIGRGKAGKPALLGQIDGLGGMTLLVALSCFHFDEDNGSPVDGDQIEFPQAGADAASDDSQPVAPKIASREGLTLLA